MAIWRHFVRHLGCLRGGARCSRFIAKTNTKQQVSKSILFVIVAPCGVGRPCSHFGEASEPKIEPKSNSKHVLKLIPKITTFWTNAGSTLGSSQRRLKMGQCLELRCSASPDGCVFTNVVHGKGCWNYIPSKRKGGISRQEPLASIA